MGDICSAFPAINPPATRTLIGGLLLRGMLVGVIAGLLAFGFAKAFGEPQVDRAIAFESAMDRAKGEAPDPELIGRPVQSTVGLLTGIVVYGTAVGGLYALVFATLFGRVNLGPRELAALLALAGLIAIVVVPGLKYPANPPSVGNPQTIGFRTQMYFLMIAYSIAATAFAAWTCARLAGSYGAWNAALVAGALFVLVVAIAQYALPEVDEIPPGFPAVVLWRFRLASLGIHLVLWTTLGLLFGWITDRKLRVTEG